MKWIKRIALALFAIYFVGWLAYASFLVYSGANIGEASIFGLTWPWMAVMIYIMAKAGKTSRSMSHAR